MSATCEVITYRRFNEGQACGEPAACRLTGEASKEPFHRAVSCCMDCRDDAERDMRRDGCYMIQAEFLLDTPQGHIARIESELLNAVWNLVASYEPADRDAMKWLDKLLCEMDDRLHSDGSVRRARDEAEAFWQAAEEAKEVSGEVKA